MRFAQGRADAAFSPLPLGEGWGEGQGRVEAISGKRGDKGRR